VETCAGEVTTYTTDKSAPLQEQYILFAFRLQEDFAPGGSDIPFIIPLHAV